MNFFSTNLKFIPRSVIFSKRCYSFNPKLLLDNSTIKNEQITTTIIPSQEQSTRDINMKVGVDGESHLKELRQQKKERPISPHLTIFRMPLTAGGSLSHRATGIILAFGFTGVTLTFALSSTPAFYWVAWLQQYHPFIHGVVKYGATFCVVSHIISGFRHLVWDHGIGVETVENVKFNIKLHLAIASVLTALTAFIHL